MGENDLARIYVGGCVRIKGTDRTGVVKEIKEIGYYGIHSLVLFDADDYYKWIRVSWLEPLPVQSEWRIYGPVGQFPCPPSAETVQLARLGDDRPSEWCEDAETAFLHLLAECQRRESL